MKERPILFSGPMVRAILDSRKTQTRRFARLPIMSVSDGAKRRVFVDKDIPLVNEFLAMRSRHPDPCQRPVCPYGVPGDRLWVRETWGIGGTRLVDPCLNYRADGAQVPLVDGVDVGWCIGSRPLVGVDDAALLAVKDGWRSSMFMPRWASRITLEITEVRIQRVQDISNADAASEGVEPCGNCVHLGRSANCRCAERFQRLWDSINGKKHPWQSNPWVWAISFRRV